MSNKSERGQDLLLGKLLGERYRIERLLGKGGMGSVYSALQTNVGRKVAVKVLAAALSNDPIAVERFKNEARIICELRHPNTLKLHDVGELDDGRLFLVMELLDGHPLSELLANGRLGPRRTLQILIQVTDSLAEAHRKGITHRDLKPANIFVERIADQEIAKVLDFGIAKLAGQPKITTTGTIFGTPTYMAPEQALGEPGPKSDVYSLGVILYECLSGQVPFESENPMALLYRHINEPPVPLSKLPVAAELPAGLADLTMQMLEKAPEERPQSILAVRAAFDRILRTLDGPVVSTEVESRPMATGSQRELITIATQPVGKLVPKARRAKLAAAVAACILAVSALGFAVFWFEEGSRRANAVEQALPAAQAPEPALPSSEHEGLAHPTRMVDPSAPERALSTSATGQSQRNPEEPSIPDPEPSGEKKKAIAGESGSSTHPGPPHKALRKKNPIDEAKAPKAVQPAVPEDEDFPETDPTEIERVAGRVRRN